MPKQMPEEQMKVYRQKLARSALGQKAHLSPRDIEVINNAEEYRILVYDARLPDGRWEATVVTGIEAFRVLQIMMPEVRARALVYAIMGQRQALIPPSRYEELFTQPMPVKASSQR